MIRRAIRSIRPFRRPDNDLPYGMFEGIRTDKEAACARRLERIYHKGQDKAWNGKELLDELVQRHGGRIELSADKQKALRNLFAVILWGELAAWKISSQLADALEPMEAKLAATAQAHDEARHFYVMHDYLALLGYEPGPLPPMASRALHEVLRTDDLVKKLMGMQLMIEPIALTIFQVTRERKLEPVLCDLLVYFERDEARHVALGVNELPRLLEGLTWPQAIGLWTWQLKMLELEMRGMRELESSFATLGIPPLEVMKLGQAKQLLAIRMMTDELGHDLPVMEAFRRIFDFRIALSYPPADLAPGRTNRLRHALRAARRGDLMETSLVTSPGA